MLINARETAYQALYDVVKRGVPSGRAVETVGSNARLDRKDRALAVRILLGCIQQRYLLDHILSRYSKNKPESLDPEVRLILHIALYQLHFLDRIPDHAVVDEAVRLAHVHCPRAVSFINAVLRRAVSDPERSVLKSAVPGDDLSMRFSTEKWFSDYLVSCYGTAFAEEFLQRSNEIPQTCLQVNLLKTSFRDYLDKLEASGVDYRIARQEKSVFVNTGSVRDLPGYDDGLFYVQDPAAAACADIAGVFPGARVMDACSSPGGKSFSASIRMNNAGEILAFDINRKKIDLISQSAQRLGIGIVHTGVADARNYIPEFESAFDFVFADVPCSGFGVIGKKPEIKYKPYSQIQGLPEIQSSILTNLASYVKPGGTLLYSTCTIIREENEGVVSRFLQEHADYATADFTVFGRSSSNGMYTFWPQVDETDGFFIAKLKRNER